MLVLYLSPVICPLRSFVYPPLHYLFPSFTQPQTISHEENPFLSTHSRGATKTSYQSVVLRLSPPQPTHFMIK